MHPIIATTSIDFAGSWSKFWTAISGSLGGLTTILSIVGMLLVVGGILGYIWERRKGGGGGGHSKLGWTILVGAILAGPNVVIPALLTLFDFAANVIVSALKL